MFRLLPHAEHFRFRGGRRRSSIVVQSFAASVIRHFYGKQFFRNNMDASFQRRHQDAKVEKRAIGVDLAKVASRSRRHINIAMTVLASKPRLHGDC
jgi:hypothetical protein